MVFGYNLLLCFGIGTSYNIIYGQCFTVSRIFGNFEIEIINN